MKLNIILSAVAATALMSGAAFAQATDSPVPDSTMQSGKSMTAPKADPTLPSTTSTDPMAPTESTGTPTTTPDAGTPAADTGTATTTSVTATDPANGASVTNSTVTNGPVPDTAENRAKYGKPMSNAGKRTAPKGN